MRFIRKYISSRLQAIKSVQDEEPYQFFYKYNKGEKSIVGMLDVDTLEGLAESLQEMLSQSPEKEVTILNVKKGSVFDTGRD